MTDSPTPTASRSIAVLTGFVILVFCTGTAEYLVAGVLPQLADDVGVSVPTAGQLVTAYALGVAVGGPVVTVATARLPRKGLAVGLGVLFLVGLLLTVTAPTFVLIIVGRVVSACAQATLFAIGLTTAANAMGPEKAGQAIAIVSSGLTVSTVLGVPLGSLLSSGSSWRLPFAVLAVVAALGTALLAVTMPRTAAPTTGVRDEIGTLLRGPVLLAVSTTVVGFAGVSIVFTYLVPLLTEVTGIASGVIPALLLAYGVGGFAGNLVAGRLADLSLGRTLTGVFVILIVTLLLFPLGAGTVPVMVVLVLVLGLLSTATIAPLQSLVLRHAGDAPTLSLAVNVGAFNLANAIGAALGGVTVAGGLLRWGGFFGAAFALAGLALTLLPLRIPAPTTHTAEESA
ncbi:Inner membrane transport protein YdhP [Corynebacterium provencense]|uniref:Inner membrane transport protein YdhP n=1 Tax=Corynebacterium provencense TaxID=1737425 RepID=A0A2Z3YQA3_9CORY|nr:MFS transporter [Corynebacterium provencense]AWT26339.1 Inner membrane transport protein YdhP [Corynebacterium provencense]